MQCTKLGPVGEHRNRGSSKISGRVIAAAVQTYFTALRWKIHSLLEYAGSVPAFNDIWYLGVFIRGLIDRMNALSNGGFTT